MSEIKYLILATARCLTCVVAATFLGVFLGDGEFVRAAWAAMVLISTFPFDEN